MPHADGQNAPPPAIDCARVLSYAVLDSSVQFSGDSSLFVDGKRLGEVRCLAVCEELGLTSDVLLFHCTRDWRVLGCSAHPSVEAAKIKTERIYRGVRAKWIDANVSREEAVNYLDTLIDGQKCDRCGRRPYEVDRMVKGSSGWICDRCGA